VAGASKHTAMSYELRTNAAKSRAYNAQLAVD
jgi:hypothetical protein